MSHWTAKGPIPLRCGDASMLMLLLAPDSGVCAQ
jgi:hypothetical protein